MRGLWMWICAALPLAVGCCSAAGQDKAQQEKAPVDPVVASTEVNGQTEFERLLGTEHQKRQTDHFIVETSLDRAASIHIVTFCEWSYNGFLSWSGRKADQKLWEGRVRVLIIGDKVNWERLLTHWTQGKPAYVSEQIKNAGGLWCPSPPMVIIYASEWSRGETGLRLFHFLNHLFLGGTTGSRRETWDWWLLEAFSWFRSVEVFGKNGQSCGMEEREEDLTTEGQAWWDPGKWVALLKASVSNREDENLSDFFSKESQNVRLRTMVKAWSLVKWLVRDDDQKARFLKFVVKLTTENDREKAFREIFGMSFAQTDKAWREWILLQPIR